MLLLLPLLKNGDTQSALPPLCIAECYMTDEEEEEESLILNRVCLEFNFVTTRICLDRRGPVERQPPKRREGAAAGSAGEEVEQEEW